LTQKVEMLWTTVKTNLTVVDVVTGGAVQAKMTDCLVEPPLWVAALLSLQVIIL
jgi:hypothetical protein